MAAFRVTLVKFDAFTSFGYTSNREIEGKFVRVDEKFVTKAVFSSGLERGRFGLNAALINLHNLDVEAAISVKVLDASLIEDANRVFVAPKSSSDWEMASLNAVEISNSLLDQMAIVEAAKPIVVFLNNGIKIFFDVEDDDKKLRSLKPTTEISIKPKDGEKIFPELPSNFKPVDHFKGRQLRVCVKRFSDLKDKFRGFVKTPFKNSKALIRFEIIPFPELENPEKTVRTLECVFEYSEDLPEGSLILSEELAEAFKLDLGTKIRIIDTLESLSESSSKAVLYKGPKATFDISEEETPIVIPNDSLIVLKDRNCSILTRDDPVIAINEDNFDIKDVVSINRSDQVQTDVMVLSGVEKVVDLLLSGIRFNVLLQGETGSGKSTTLKQIAKKCRENFIFAKIVECKKLIGKKAELVDRDLKAASKLCHRRRPAVLILDDLDALFIQEKIEENRAEANYVNGLANILLNILEDEDLEAVAVLAAVEEVQRLHKNLIPGAGSHGFDRVVDLGRPTSEQRGRFCPRGFNVERFETLTEGFLPIDLKRLETELKLAERKSGKKEKERKCNICYERRPATNSVGFLHKFFAFFACQMRIIYCRDGIGVGDRGFHAHFPLEREIEAEER